MSSGNNLLPISLKKVSTLSSNLSFLFTKDLWFSENKSLTSNKLKINKFMFEVKQLKMDKLIKYIWQLIISTSNATLEVPSLCPWTMYSNRQCYFSGQELVIKPDYIFSTIAFLMSFFWLDSTLIFGDEKIVEFLNFWSNHHSADISVIWLVERSAIKLLILMHY